MSKMIITEIQKRFADIDIFRHVNNVSQQEYFDIGKTDYYNQVIGCDVFFDRVALMIVSVKTDFIEQIRYEDRVYVKTWVGAIGNKSITISQQIICRAEDGTENVCTQSESVLVTFDRKQKQTIEVPQEWREKIEI